MSDARVIFEPTVKMTSGESSVVAFAVTLDQTTPADEILQRPGPQEEFGYRVSCRVQALLEGSPYEFEISEGDWVDRSFVTTDTARWSWYVTPKIGGDSTLVTRIRPILHIEDLDAGFVTEEDLDSSIKEFETRVSVTVPWTERPQEMLSRLAKTLQIAEGFVKALTGVVLAVGGLFAALGIKKYVSRKRNQEDPA
ncbi:hypothetical protein ACI3EQ_15510 [Ornithinimicrobium sp. LYQ103]